MWTAIQYSATATTANKLYAVRIGCRRLRALLDSWPQEAYTKAHSSIKADLEIIATYIADARNADTHHRLLGELAKKPSLSRIIERYQLRTELQRERARIRSKLHRLVNSAAWSQLIDRINGNIHKLQSVHAAEHSRQTTDNHAYRLVLKRSITKATRSLSKSANSARRMHRQRSRIKQARYICGLVSPRLHVPLRPVETSLHKAQRMLSNLRDWRGLRNRLRSMTLPNEDKKALVLHAKRKRLDCESRYRREAQPALLQQLRKFSKVYL